MFTPRASAIACALLFLLPLTPMVAAAEPDCSNTECTDLRLFFVSGGLSSLWGDSMQSDRSTRAVGTLRGATPTLPSSLLISTTEPFRITIAGSTASGDFANASYTVDAVDLIGRSVRLGELEIRPWLLAPQREVQDTVNGTLTHPVVSALRPTIESGARAARNQLATLDGNVASNVVNHTIDNVTCPGQPTSLQVACDQIHGNIGQGVTRPCAAGSPSNSIIAQLVWTAVQSWERGQVQPLPNVPPGVIPPTEVPRGEARQICKPIRDDVNETTAHGPHVESPVDGLDPGFNATPPEPRPTPPDWRNVNFTVRSPSEFARDGSFLVIPSGFRIVVNVNVTVSRTLGGPFTPAVMDHGRNDAQTRIMFTTGSPGAFAQFASPRAPILPGEHTGTFANTSHVANYALEVPEGARLHVQTDGHFFSLFSPTGQGAGGMGPNGVPATPGSWTLRVFSHGPVQSPSQQAVQPYRFTLTYPTEESDGGLLDENGRNGTLGDGDASDSYTFAANRGQRFTLHLAFPATASYGLAITASVHDRVVQNAPQGQTLSAIAATPGAIAVSVERYWGEGAYDLSLELGPIPPTLSHVATLAGGASRVSGYEDGVDLVVTSPGQPPKAIHVTSTGDITLLPSTPAPGSRLARTAAGDVVAAQSAGGFLQTVVAHGSETNPVANRLTWATFLADGRLVGILPGTGLVAIDADRHEDLILDGVPELPLVAPDGTVYAGRGSGTIAIDVSTGTATPAPAGLHGVLAFDALGRGYRVGAPGLIERYDPETNTSTIVAQVEWGRDIRDLAISDGSLFALDADIRMGTALGLSATPISAGWTGFHPAFAPAPAPDLVPVQVVDEVVDIGLAPDATTAPGETHRTRITVANTGAGPAGPTNLTVGWSCGSFCPSWTLPVPALGPGQATVVAFEWHSGGHVGHQEFRAVVDPLPFGGKVVETDESNNGLSYEATVLADLRSACLQATAAAGHPVILGLQDTAYCRLARA